MIRSAFLARSAALAAAPPFAWFDGARTEFRPSELRDDLDFLWNAMLEVGTAPFLTSDRSEVEAQYRGVRAALREPLDARAFWLRAAPVFAALNDGHVSVLPPFATAQQIDVPVQLALDGDELFVTAAADGAIAPGSRLVALEGMPAAEFAAHALRMAGGQTPVLHASRVRGTSRVLAYALFGPRPRYALRWTAPDGTEHDARIPSAHLRTPDDGSGEPYAYRTAGGGRLGCIDYRACVDRARFRRFLDATFRAIREAPVRALAIDLRENGGGDDALNADLWAYLAPHPYKEIGSTVVRAAARLKREYGRTRYVAEFGAAAWDAPDGTLVRYEYPLIEPAPNPLRYAGPVYVLIGPRTFSSAMGCAIAAKDFGLATVVGEETGEPVNGTGEIYTVTAPATRTFAAFPTKVYLGPKPRPDGEGVVPDITVRTTRAEIVAARDPVMERVLAEL